MNEHPEAIEPPDENVKAEPSADAAEGADAGGAAVDAAAEADPIDAAPAGDDAVDGEPAGDEPAGDEPAGDESAEAVSAGDEPAGGEPEPAATGDDVAGDEEKAPSAYRTISEVSVSLDVPQHVLRFWETKFAQLRPMKRGGGRRYYRPEDVALLKLVKGWLYDEGLTIKGVQKRLKGRGMRQALTEEGELPEVAPPKPRKRLPPLPEPVRQEIGDILTELRAIRAELGTQ